MAPSLLASPQVRFLPGASPEGPVAGRRYTYTHSDLTGRRYLTVGPDYDRRQFAGWYARLLRDEVLAEWREEPAGAELHVGIVVSADGILGPARWRDAVFRRALPSVLRAWRRGDARLFAAHPELEEAPVWVHFHSQDPRYNRTERWGRFGAYRPGAGDGRR